MGTTWAQLDERIFAAAWRKRIPVSGGFELTARCNLGCVMCYLRKAPGDSAAMCQELTGAQWLELAQQARDQGLLYALLTGGEIFLHPDFKMIYEGMSRMGLLITLYTNGTLITPEVADWLSLNPPQCVSISMYGASPETYQRITGQGDGYQRVLRAVELLQQRKIQVELKTTWVEGNQEDFKALFEYAFSRGIRFGIVNYVFPTRETCGGDPVGNRLDAAKLAEFEKNAEEYIGRRLMELTGKEHPGIRIFNPDEEVFEHPEEVNGAFFCDAGATSFWITWDGGMVPCGVMSEPKVDVKLQSFDAAWTELKAATRRVPDCQQCLDCEMMEACLSCPARLHSETGAFDKPAPYLCAYAGKRIEMAIKEETRNG